MFEICTSITTAFGFYNWSTFSKIRKTVGRLPVGKIFYR